MTLLRLSLAALLLAGCTANVSGTLRPSDNAVVSLGTVITEGGIIPSGGVSIGF